MNSKNYQKLRKGQKKKFFDNIVNDEELFGTTDLRAVIYVRVSSQHQVQQGHGLESQERVCRERCSNQKGKSIEVVKVFREEGVSGSIMDRKAMLDAIDFLAQQNKTSKKIHYFVVTDSDRIARPDDIGEAFLLEGDIEATGVRIITINSKRDNQTDEGKLMNGLQYLIAGYERMKTLRRTMNGRVTSMKSGGRPLSHVPLGYIREKISEKIYKDTIDPVLGPIIKEGLELYAYTPTLTKAQLQKFWFDKGLRTKKTTNKLYRSFIDKTFLDYRLYFYAGYVYYPDRQINEPVVGKHPGLIDIKVVNKIFEKENSKDGRVVRGINITTDNDTHPLKKLVTCEGCGRTYGCYPAKGGKYFYYDCANKYCESRIYVPKDKMEDEFKHFISIMCLPDGIFKIFREIVLEKRKEKKKVLFENIPKLQGEILSLNDRIEKIKNKILSTNNEELSQELENDRANLRTLRDIIQEKIDNKKEDNYDINEMLDNIEEIFNDPVAMRENSNYDVRQLLFKVRFGGILYYKKNQGYRTNDMSGLYCIFIHKGDDDSSSTSHRGIEPLFPASETSVIPVDQGLREIISDKS